MAQRRAKPVAESLVHADDLLNGVSLRVVLHPDPESQTAFPDMVEAFDLPHIVLHGSEFIAKTSNAHALPHDTRAYDPNFVTSYAYSNFLNLVINCCAAENLFRAYSATAYQEIRFVAKSTYETVWEYGVHDTTAALERTIEAGKRLKIAVLDEGDIWNIHPVHMPSFYVGRNHFELFTEQDALPTVFRFPAALKRMDRNVRDGIEKAIKTGGVENKKYAIIKNGLQSNSSEYYSCYYTVWPNGEFLRGECVHTGANSEKYKALKVFAEK